MGGMIFVILKHKEELFISNQNQKRIFCLKNEKVKIRNCLKLSVEHKCQ